MADSPGQTLALARTAAEAVRGLNHATLGGEGLDQPADAYELIGELALAAAGLPQLLAQVTRWLASGPGRRAARLRRRHRPGRRGHAARLFISGAAGSRRGPGPRPRLRAAAARPRQRPPGAAHPEGHPDDRYASCTTSGSPACRSAGTCPRHTAPARRPHGEAAARITWAVADIGNPRYQNVLNARRDTCAA